jgi:hypothetical protein
VVVTYVKPAIGTEAAGFFVQEQQRGPALFVAVDPTTLTPAPQPGDRVSFTVTSVDKVGGLRQATAVSGYAQLATGVALAPLTQDVTAATDLVTNLDGYESELVHVQGTPKAAFVASGGGFVAAQLDTGGVTGSTLLKLRVPLTLRDSLDLAANCQLTVVAAPLWRFNTSSEPSAWTSADLTVQSCPAPKVVSAVAESPTSLLVNFDRLIAPASLAADASQFTFTNGLTASAAVLSAPRQVTLTTATQTALASYTVTVAGTLTDQRASGIDPAAATALFTGYVTPAGLRINEVSPNIGGSVDLIELLVTSTGNTNGAVLAQDVASPIALATLPDLNVVAGDLIVVHLTPATTTTTETGTKSDCTAAACYGSAWDVRGGTTGITFSDRVLTIAAADGTVQDAVAFARTTLSTPPAGFPADLQAIQGKAWWQPADCAGAPCTYSSTPTALAVSADWSNVGATAGGMSCARKANGDTDQASDWAVGAASFGMSNP